MENPTSCNASPLESEPSEKPPASRESNTELMNYFHSGTMNNKVTALDNVFDDDPSPKPVAHPQPPPPPPPPPVAEESSSAKVEETATVYGSMTELACGGPTEKLEIKEDCDDDKNKGKKKRAREEKRGSPRTEFCTPSYALIEGAREEHKYLNTTCKIVYRLEETKPKEKSGIDKCKDKIEDDIFETDMCKKRLEATIESAMRQHEKAIMGLPPTDGDRLSALELRAIKSVFPREGERIVEALRSNPKVALPVVIKFLEGKRDQCQYMLTHVLKFEKNKTYNELSSEKKEK